MAHIRKGRYGGSFENRTRFLLNIIKEMKAAAPDMVIVGTDFSWFREYGANIAAGCIVKDSKIYLPVWREVTKGRTMMRARVGEHI